MRAFVTKLTMSQMRTFLVLIGLTQIRLDLDLTGISEPKKMMDKASASNVWFRMTAVYTNILFHVGISNLTPYKVHTCTL